MQKKSDGCETKNIFLLYISELRKKIATYKFVNVLHNDKFSKNIVEFINKNFISKEHCFIFIGGCSREQFPLPEGENIFDFPSPICLPSSNTIKKFIFHGLYNNDVIRYLYQSPEILKKSYWIPWGGDIYEDDNSAITQYVKSHFQGIGGNLYVKKIYQQKYGGGEKVLPFNFTYASIAYDKIISTSIPSKNYIQIMVNNSTHKTTLEIFKNLKKFRSENIRITTVLSYGDQEWRDKILRVGKNIFGEKFFPVLRYIPGDFYIKLLARNNIYILNHHRPQGMTTLFTSLLLGTKVFMRAEINGYLKEEGYTIYDTNTIPTLSFEDLCAAKNQEENKRLSASRFDEAFIKQCWQRLFAYTP